MGHPQFDNTFEAPRWTAGLLPYIAATIFFIFVGAVTILGPDLRLADKTVSPSAGRTAENPAPPAPEKGPPAALTPSSAPKLESWEDTLTAFQQAIADKKASKDEAEHRKLIEQVREGLNSKNR